MRGADEGLHQPRTILVAGFEILRHTRQHLAQHLAGQVAALHPGADQEPAQGTAPGADGLGVAQRSIPSTPRAPAIATPRPKTRPRPAGRRRRACAPESQIANLAARKGRRPLRMLEVQQGIPHPALPALLYQLQRQPRDRLHRTRHRRGRRHRRVETLRHRRAPAAPRRRQRNPPPALCSVLSALRQPASWADPRASTNPNSAHTRRPTAARLFSDSCDTSARPAEATCCSPMASCACSPPSPAHASCRRLRASATRSVWSGASAGGSDANATRPADS